MRLLTGLSAALCLLGAWTVDVNAQPWPDKPVRMLVLSGPGGSPDVAARTIAQQLSQSFGKQFVVENKLGAGGIVGLSALKTSAPDGYTVALGPASAIVTTPRLFKDIPFDIDKDFVPVAFVGKTPIVVAVKKDSPFRTFEDLLGASRKAKEPLAIGTTSTNSLPHLLAILAGRKADGKFLAVPFSTSPQGITALLGGDVVAMVDGSPSFEGMVRNGDLRLLASFADKRLASNQGLPVIAENAPGVAASGWFGILAPKGTPQDIIDKLRTGINDAMAKPDVEAKLTSLSIFPERMNGPEFSMFLTREKAFWADALENAGAKPE
jgi:tripartite-type tricarboxylate transporter receptor subunit TctC